ncbi:MAG: LrgB family protein [Butyricicoccus pullicaecorum]|nr:LrgB family protein [Butyricicoccus pullicaecorum]MDO4668263.1 LrgB family protein [Butyricicoccus pullicaecorum]
MSDILSSAAFFGVMISILTYELGLWLKQKTKLALCNPLLISIILTIATLLCLGIDYESYHEGAKYLSYLLTPATVCLAIPLYEQLHLLVHNVKAILIGILAGVLSSIGSVFALCLAFELGHTEYVTLLPKSITTAIGMGLSEELGGIVTITVSVIIVTGVIGNILAESICRHFRITHPIAKGIAIGTAAHAIGTARALEMGEIEGAMSSLAIAVSGLITVGAASLFSNLI